MNAETEAETSSLTDKAAKGIHKYIKSKTDGIELSEYEEINAEMAVTQICGLSDIHRATWYDNGVIYKLMQQYESISYEPGSSIQIDAKKFLEEYNA